MRTEQELRKVLERVSDTIKKDFPAFDMYAFGWQDCIEWVLGIPIEEGEGMTKISELLDQE